MSLGLAVIRVDWTFTTALLINGRTDSFVCAEQGGINDKQYIAGNVPVDLLYQALETEEFEFRPGLIASREAYAPSLGDQFVSAIAKHHYWEREPAV
jgi:hypothetical protein